MEVEQQDTPASTHEDASNEPRAPGDDTAAESSMAVDEKWSANANEPTESNASPHPDAQTPTNENTDAPVEEQVVEENSQSKRLEGALEALKKPDAILENDVLANIKAIFDAGAGTPREIIHYLSTSYHGFPQMCNLVSFWLRRLGTPDSEIIASVEGHIRDEIKKNFDPHKADRIFQMGSAPVWLLEMIKHKTWRYLIYELSDANRTCLLLNYGIQEISRAGYDEEIASLPSASTYFSVFNRVLSDTVNKALQQPEWELTNALSDFARMYSHAEHTYIHTQAALHELAESDPSGKLRRISQELDALGQTTSLESQNLLSSSEMATGWDDSSVMGMSDQSASANEKQKVQFCQSASALMTSIGLFPSLSSSILSVLRSTTNPSPVDVRNIQQAFMKPTASLNSFPTSELPMASLIRKPAFLDKLISALFNSQQEVPSEFLNSYLWVLAYASASKDNRSTYPHETPTPPPHDISTLLHDPIIHEIQEALHEVLNACRKTAVGMAMQQTQEVIVPRLKFPIVSLLVLHWIRNCICDPEKIQYSWSVRFLVSQLELLQEIAALHPLHHSRCLKLIVDACLVSKSTIDLNTANVAKRKFMQFATFLMEYGYVIPVLKQMEILAQTLDQAVIRHFLITTLDMAAPPYSITFLEPIIKMLSNVRVEATDQRATVSQFAEHVLKPGEYQLSSPIREQLRTISRNCSNPKT